LIEVNAFAGESKTSCAPERQGSLCLFSELIVLPFPLEGQTLISFQGDDPCKAPNPCRHNGRCNSTEGSFQCNCTSSRYTGDKCQDGKAFSSLIQPYSCIQVITLCNSHNCGTGRCDEVKRNKTLQPFCTCKAGTTGPTCNESTSEESYEALQKFTVSDVNFCKGVHCYYDKTCINGASDYTCQCGEGYEGKKCEKEIESAGINKVILIAAGGGGGFVLLFALCGIFLLSHRKKKKRRALGRSSLAMGSVMESSMAGQSILASILKGSTMKSTVSRTESTMNKKGATKNATPTKSPSPKKVKNP
ncbi:EGF-like domain protein, partial [Trichuris suis]